MLTSYPDAGQFPLTGATSLLHATCERIDRVRASTGAAIKRTHDREKKEKAPDDTGAFEKLI
jgi:hypothetical protein